MKLKRLFFRTTPQGKLVFTWFTLYVSVWIKLLAAVVGVITLGFVTPLLTLRWLSWVDRRWSGR